MGPRIGTCVCTPYLGAFLAKVRTKTSCIFFSKKKNSFLQISFGSEVLKFKIDLTNYTWDTWREMILVSPPKKMMILKIENERKNKVRGDLWTCRRLVRCPACTMWSDLSDEIFKHLAFSLLLLKTCDCLLTI